MAGDPLPSIPVAEVIPSGIVPPVIPASVPDPVIIPRSNTGLIIGGICLLAIIAIGIVIYKKSQAQAV